jgi:hypothetical protein
MKINFEGKEKYLNELNIKIIYRQGEFFYNELVEIAKELKIMLEKKLVIVNSIEIKE